MGDLNFNPASGRPELLSFGNVGRNSSTGGPASGYVPLSAGTLGSGDSVELTSLMAAQTGTTPENTDVPMLVANAPNLNPANVITFPGGLNLLQNPPATASGFQV